MGKRARAATEIASLKMRDLVKATGLPKSTLLFYVAEGLLPPPVRTGRNIARYLPECVERARLVRQFQKHKRMTIAEIREYMAHMKDPREMEAILRLEQAVFGQERDGARYTREEFLAASGLGESVLDQMLDASLIVPMEDGTFDDEDLSAARMLALSLSMGLRISDFSHYPRAARALVEKDLALRARLTKDLENVEDADRTVEMTRNARLYRIYLFDRTFIRAVSGMRTLKG